MRHTRISSSRTPTRTWIVGGDRSVLTTVDGRQLTVSNLDKVLYPDSGFTKGQVIDYYVRIAEVMLPHVRDRPLTMKRYPDGVDGESFFEKHLPEHAPPWVRHVAVPSGAGSIEYAVICDLPTLVWAANLAAIEFHVPLWHVGRRRTLPGPPDHMVFDLDPGEGASIVECCRVARSIVEVLAEGRAGCRPKTSGSKGLQLYVPLPGRPTWERVRDRAHGIAVQLEQDQPDLVVSTLRKSLRTGKVLIDWGQNHPAKTTVAAYSLRGRSEPTASTPLTWDEVDQGARGGDPAGLRFTADAVLDRVEEHGDLFAAV
jgi:bifunctional non-homologous end joining protein LigD